MSIKVYFLLLSALVPAVAGANATGDEIRDQYYLGAGLGMSFLKPSLNDSVLVANQGSDLAYRFMGGYQFTDQISAEVFFTDLGQARILSNVTGGVAGLVGYQYFGAGAVYQYPLSERWGVIATAGLGLLQNQFQLVAAQRDDAVSLYAGVGAAWRLTNDVSLRAEYDYYATDASSLSVTIVKRFGSKTPKRFAAIEKQLKRQDDDIANANVSIARLTTKPIVKQKTCDGYFVEFDGVYFTQGSIELSEKSKMILDDLAVQLLRLPPDVRFEIRAHADEVGTELYNYRLSLTRARVVRDYLATRGVMLSRSEAFGYGEWDPVKNSVSKPEHAINRRVDVVLVGVEKYVEDISVCPEFSVKKLGVL